MQKHAFSGTGDGFSLENLDGAYSLVNIECMIDTCDGIKKQKIALPVIYFIFAPNVFYDVSEHDNGDDGCNDENV